MTAPLPYYVVGHPLGHSMSPFIHTRLFALQNRPASYEARDIPPEELASVLPGLIARAGGVNVTIPHKQAVIPLLARLEGRAALYRSVNTIAPSPEGPVGYNTDAEGFLRALEAGGVSLAGRVALLGCGGVGRTFACEAALAGCRVVNAVRPEDAQAAKDLREYVLSLAPGAAYELTTLTELEGEFDLLINATPVGMYPKADAAPVGRAAVSRCAAVFDAVYNPGKTRLLALAEEAGAKAIGGMPMLVWQAAAAHTYWYGAQFRKEDVARLIEDADREMDTVFNK